MGILSFLFGKKTPPSHLQPAPDGRSTSFDRADHLGRAASAKKRGKAAVQRADFETAWRHFHEQKAHYYRHANRYGMTARQALALDGEVHEDLANILRLEGKNDEALAHLLFCVVSSPRPTKAQSKKLVTYFSRCGFSNVALTELAAFLAKPCDKPDFLYARARVGTWRKQSDASACMERLP